MPRGVSPNAKALWFYLAGAAGVSGVAEAEALRAEAFLAVSARCWSTWTFVSSEAQK